MPFKERFSQFPGAREACGSRSASPLRSRSAVFKGVQALDFFFLFGGACAEPSMVICRIMINIRMDGFNEPPLYLLRFGGLGSLSHAPGEIRRIRSFS